MTIAECERYEKAVKDGIPDLIENFKERNMEISKHEFVLCLQYCGMHVPRGLDFVDYVRSDGTISTRKFSKALLIPISNAIDKLKKWSE